MYQLIELLGLLFVDVEGELYGIDILASTLGSTDEALIELTVLLEEEVEGFYHLILGEARELRMQLAVFCRISLHSLLHIGIDAVGILAVKVIIFAVDVFGARIIKETFQLLQAFHYTIKLLELGSAIENFSHIRSCLVKKVFQTIGIESYLVEIDGKAGNRLTDARLGIIYVITEQLTEIEEIESYLAVQVYLYECGIYLLGKFQILILDSLDKQGHLRRVLRNAASRTYHLVTILHQIIEIGIGKESFQWFDILLCRHILEVESIDGRQISDLLLTLGKCLLLLFLVFCSHCFLLLFYFFLYEPATESLGTEAPFMTVAIWETVIKQRHKRLY